MPKKSLAEGILEELKKHDAQSAKIQVSFQTVEQLLNKRVGGPTAFVVTKGFEQWLALSRPIYPLWPHHDTTHYQRRNWIPLHSEHICSVNERVNHLGEVTHPLNIEELQQHVIKLQEKEIEHVVICFLHSNQNAEHELQAESFFRENGFKTFISSAQSSANEVERWSQALALGFVQPALDEIMGDIQDFLNENGCQIEFEFWQDTKRPLHSRLEYSSRWGLETSIQNWLKDRDIKFHLHFGLEKFLFLSPNEDESTNNYSFLQEHENKFKVFAPNNDNELSLQPTSELAQQNWPMPTLSDKSRGYEPGPICFGKSLNLTLIDILVTQDEMPKVEVFENLISERAKAKIKDALFTLSKDLSDGTTVEVSEVAEDLWQSAVDRVSNDLFARGAFGSVSVSGVLAKPFITRLKALRPDLKFEQVLQSEWLESRAAVSRLQTEEA